MNILVFVLIDFRLCEVVIVLGLLIIDDFRRIPLYDASTRTKHDTMQYRCMMRVRVQNMIRQGICATLAYDNNVHVYV